MKSVSPDGMPSTTELNACPAVAESGYEAIGAAAVISPVTLITGGPSGGAGATPGALTPYMIACDLRW